MEVSSDVTAPGTSRALGRFVVLDLWGLKVFLLPWDLPIPGESRQNPWTPLLLNSQGLRVPELVGLSFIGQSIFLPQTNHTKHDKFNEISFLSCLCYITDEANKHIQTSVESTAALGPAFPEDVADAGGGR